MDPMTTRLNKYLSEAGHCSRRAADKLIDEGRVTINGIVPEMGTKVIPGDEVKVDGKTILNDAKKRIYIAFNKPVGVVCTTDRGVEKDNIIDYICKKYEVSKIELLGKKRTLDIVRSRNIIHNLLNEKYKMNLTNIGRYFKQDHTTVLHSIKMKANKKRYWSEEQTIWQEFQELKEVL